MNDQGLAIANLVDIGGSGVSGARNGGSVWYKLENLATLTTVRWTPASDVCITAFYLNNAGACNFALTKNGMTVASAGELADASGTAIAAPATVPGDQIIWVGSTATPFFYSGLNVWVHLGETVYISKNQNSTPQVTIWYDYLTQV